MFQFLHTYQWVAAKKTRLAARVGDLDELFRPAREKRSAILPTDERQVNELAALQQIN